MDGLASKQNVIRLTLTTSLFLDKNICVELVAVFGIGGNRQPEMRKIALNIGFVPCTLQPGMQNGIGCRIIVSDIFTDFGGAQNVNQVLRTFLEKIVADGIGRNHIGVVFFGFVRNVVDGFQPVEPDGLAVVVDLIEQVELIIAVVVILDKIGLRCRCGWRGFGIGRTGYQ